MTAVPHDRVSRVRSRGAGARLVRPGRTRLATREGDAVAGLSVGDVSPGWMSALGASISIDHLRIVLAGRRVRLGNGAFVLALLAALSLTLIVLLVLNTALTTDSFELQQLRRQDNQLSVRGQQLQAELALAKSPLAFQARARELGMVPAANSPVFLSVDQGKVLGEAKPAPMPAAPAKPKPKPAITTGVDGYPPATDTDGGESAAVAVGESGSALSVDDVGAAEGAGGGVAEAVPVDSMPGTSMPGTEVQMSEPVNVGQGGPALVGGGR